MAYCQHKGGKLLFFLSDSARGDFLDAVGASKLVKVGPAHHTFKAIDPLLAALVVFYLVLGVPLSADDDEIELLLNLVASSNPLVFLGIMV